MLDEIGSRNDVAILGAKAGDRLVEAHLALRQRDDRLQVEIDAVGVDRAGDQLVDAVARQSHEAARNSALLRRLCAGSGRRW